jgi:spoIIIJ-associated protein
MSEKKGILGFFKGWTTDEDEDVQSTEKSNESSTKKNTLNRPSEKINLVTDEIAEFSVKKLEEILKLSRFEGDVKLKFKKGFVLNLDISNVGDDLGRIIGRNGSCLQALQTLIKFFIIRKFEVSLKVVIDAGDYKNRYQSQMKRSALKAAEEVISTGESVSLDPMSSTDRRVVHVLFENHHDIITISEGEGDGRHIVLMKREDDQ